MENGKIYEYNIENFDFNIGLNNVYERRSYNASHPCVTKDFQSDVTIWIQAYNNFDKTKRCIESLFKYTSDIDFDLILVDNNAGDETYEYFKSIEYEKKTIIHFNVNTGSTYPLSVVPIDMISKYFVLLNNDIIVTKNWLSNLMKVMESDDKIGMVNAISNNASNYQGVEFEYDSYERMQEVAAQINVSDSLKWEQRLRIVTLGTLMRKECLYAMGWPFFDMGYAHNFLDDDMAFRARRAGYKLVVTSDTWICHDHFRDKKEDEATRAAYDRDKAKFMSKFCGVDPWDDTYSVFHEFRQLRGSVKSSQKNEVSILGIDPKCGMNILDIKNIFASGKDVKMSAYVQDAKYYTDLHTICNEDVICDSEDALVKHFVNKSYDYIMIGEPVNMYDDPVQIIKDAYMLLSDGGQLIFSLKNTQTIIEMIKALGYKIEVFEGIYQNIGLDNLVGYLETCGIEVDGIVPQCYNNFDSSVVEMQKMIVEHAGNKGANLKEINLRLRTDKYWLVIKKSK